MKYYFPIHLNGDNRGCEAIAKGTALIINTEKDNLLGLCTNTNLDKKLGIDKFITLISDKHESIIFRIKRKLIQFLSSDSKKVRDYTYKFHYNDFLDKATINDIMISTGGDMMCYNNNQVNYTNNYISSKGIKSILWGCSIGECNLTPEKIQTLKRFSLIYARESLTKEVLNKQNIKNVVVYPDPAFILEPEVCRLPACFNKKVIGINLSNFTMGGFSLNTSFAKEVINLISYILDYTDYNILFIPHVLWEKQNDILISTLLQEHFSSPRISILNSHTLNYCQIRYVISKCTFFIGARTHAIISAYSTKVPSIAIGYSIKSKGIAKDLNLPAQMLVDSINITPNELLNSFKYLIDNEKNIHQHYDNIIDEYKSQVWNIRKDLHKLITTD